MEEIRLGPIEWGVVTAHNPWGMGGAFGGVRR